MEYARLSMEAGSRMGILATRTGMYIPVPEQSQAAQKNTTTRLSHKWENELKPVESLRTRNQLPEVYTHTSMQVCAGSAWKQELTRVRTHTHARTNTQMHTRTQIHAHKHTHTHTHTHTRACVLAVPLLHHKTAEGQTYL
eukprot:scpid61469/ scgid15727/ 